MALGLLLGIGRTFRKKSTACLDILTAKRGPRNYYKGKNCKPTGFHTHKGGYVLVQEKLPSYVVPELTGCQLKPYVSLCANKVKLQRLQFEKLSRPRFRFSNNRY